MEEAFLFLAGTGSTILVFLVQRWIKGEATSEKIERAEKLLSINEKMRAQGMSPDDLTELQKNLISKRTDERQIEDNLQLETISAARIRPEFMTQLEMNAHAYQMYELATNKLSFIIDEIEQISNDHQKDQLRASQNAWEKYRDRQGAFAASFYEGGSIQPMMQSAELERMTLERAALLKSHLQELRETQIAR